jgi:shikimate dehydrogenase
MCAQKWLNMSATGYSSKICNFAEGLNMIEEGFSGQALKPKRLYRADGSPRPVGVIGHPVGHSLSPIFQNVAFEIHGLPHRYEKWEVAPEDLAGFLEEAKRQDYLGINATIPHKEAVMELLETGTSEVGAIGAANTLFLHEDSDTQQLLAGHNTDAQGFLEALKREANYNPKGQRTLVFGAGGSARAVVYALAKEGAFEIALLNRSFDRAAELAESIKENFPNCHIYAAPLDAAALPFNRNPRTLIVNTTSFGLAAEDQNKPFPLSAEMMSGRNPERRTVFFDLIYSPDTPFLREAQKAEAFAMNGKSMLVYQGALSFELWTGLAAPIDQMLKSLE